MPLSYKRELYRLWFEYLQVAHQSKNPAVKVALEQSANFYAPWGDVASSSFEICWRRNIHSFQEKFMVRSLKKGELPNDPDALIVEIPLVLSPTTLSRQVRKIIQEAFARNYPTAGKAKKAPSSFYKPTAGSEPKLAALQDMLTVYRDVYLKNPALRGSNLLNAVHELYKNELKKRIPIALIRGGGYSGPERALRNLSRYIQKAEKIMINVANGSFPGEH